MCVCVCVSAHSIPVRFLSAITRPFHVLYTRSRYDAEVISLLVGALSLLCVTMQHGPSIRYNVTSFIGHVVPLRCSLLWKSGYNSVGFFPRNLIEVRCTSELKDCVGGSRHTDTDTHAHNHTHTYTHKNIYIVTYRHTHTHHHTLIHTRARPHTHTKHTHTHTHTYTHKYTY